MVNLGPVKKANEVKKITPEFNSWVKDLVPYKCPKCGGIKHTHKNTAMAICYACQVEMYEVRE